MQIYGNINIDIDLFDGNYENLYLNIGSFDGNYENLNRVRISTGISPHLDFSPK